MIYKIINTASGGTDDPPPMPKLENIDCDFQRDNVLEIILVYFVPGVYAYL
jgi:hypothetical protein